MSGGARIPDWLAAAIVEWPEHRDARGGLVALEPGAAVPFPIARVFFVHGAPDRGTRRGGHAHRTCRELLIAVQGEVLVTLDDGTGAASIRLDRPTRGVDVAPRTWLELELAPGAVLLALCSHPYDEADYLRDRAAWLAAVHR